ncbi:MAG: hypothetical protein CMF56_04815 [Leifsonia sp.]|nr:hypothetical protein [Leifsonia sp.]
MSQPKTYSMHFYFPTQIEPYFNTWGIRASVELEPDPGESVISAALSALRDLGGDLAEVAEEMYDYKSPWHLEFNLLRIGASAADYVSQSDDVPMPYVVRNDYGEYSGVLVLAPHLSDSYPDATFHDLDVAVEAGYVSAQPTQIVVRLQGGRGGDGPPLSDIVIWLLDHGVDIGITAVAEFAAYRLIRSARRRRRTSRADRHARFLASEWALRNISRPATLRLWIDTKGEWSASEVADRLTLSTKSAKQLLRAVGYEEDALATWRPGTSRRSKRRRDVWLRDEDRSSLIL